MARLHHVKAAKDYPAHGIKKGDMYFWWKHMVGGRGGPKQFSKERPRPSRFQQSEYLGTFGDLEEDVGELVADSSLKDRCEEIASAFRELGEEQTSKLENMPDSLQQGSSGELLQQRADRCSEIADEFDNLDFSDAPDEVPDDAKPEDKKDRAGVDEASAQSEDEDDEETAEAYWQDKLEEVQNIDLSSE